MQVATAVAYDGLRPNLDPKSSGGLHMLLTMCWAEEPELRPPFSMVVEGIQDALRKASKAQPRRGLFR